MLTIIKLNTVRYIDVVKELNLLHELNTTV